MANTGRRQGENLEQYVARLEAENQALKNRPQAKLTMKVSEKGAVSVYGLGRFPVTLYSEQWVRLMADGPALIQFIKDNESKLAHKGDEKVA